MSIPEIISKMSLEDKISLCTGADFWHSKAMERYGSRLLFGKSVG